MEIFLAGWRNVLRNRRRTALNVLALTIGMSFTILYTGWGRGYFSTLYTGMQNFETGNLQLLNSAYLDKEIRLHLDLVVPHYHEVRTRLLSLSSVKDAAGRIDFPVRLSAKGKTVQTLCRAIDASPERRVTTIASHIAEGDYLDRGPGILIGAPLARKLDLHPGDTVSVTVRDAYGAENFIDDVVRGIYFFGYPVMDDSLLFMDYAGAASLLGMEDKATRVVIKLNDGYSLDAGLQQVRALIGSEGERDLHAYGWQTFAQPLVQGVKADISGAAMMIVIIYLLTILNILNSMSMSVRERTREIGTLRAIGMKRRTLISLLLSESVAVACIGAVLSAVLAGTAAYFLQHVGVDIGPYMPRNMPFPFGERFHADYRLYDFLAAIAVGVLMTVLGALRPALRSCRVQVAQALRSAR